MTATFFLYEMDGYDMTGSMGVTWP